MAMTSYKQILRELAAAGSEEFVNNSSMDHAAAMIEELFVNAKDEVNIFTDHLHAEVYDRPDMKQAVADFFNRDKANNKIAIMMQLNEEPLENLSKNGFVASLEKHKNQITFFKVDNEALKSVKKHFMVLKTSKDNYAMRFELDIKEHIATGTFNNESNGKKLFNFFERQVRENKVIKITDTTLWPIA